MPKLPNVNTRFVAKDVSMVNFESDFEESGIFKIAFDYKGERVVMQWSASELTCEDLDLLLNFAYECN